MASFVRVELPKCSICLEGFDSKDVPMSHYKGEQHPFHEDCLQELLNAGNQRDPIHGIQPIRCPVCRIKLPKSLSTDPIRNPSPSVQAASSQLSRSFSSSQAVTPDDETPPERSQPPVHPFDRLSLNRQIQEIIRTFNEGLIDEAFCNSCIEHLLNN